MGFFKDVAKNATVKAIITWGPRLFVLLFAADAAYDAATGNDGLVRQMLGERTRVEAPADLFAEVGSLHLRHAQENRARAILVSQVMQTLGDLEGRIVAIEGSLVALEGRERQVVVDAAIHVPPDPPMEILVVPQQANTSPNPDPSPRIELGSAFGDF